MRTTFLCVTCRASSSSRLKRRSMSAAAAGSAAHFGPDDLDRDRDTELGVPRLIDGAHAADAEQPDDVVPRTESLSRVERPAIGMDAGRLGVRRVQSSRK